MKNEKITLNELKNLRKLIGKIIAEDTHSQSDYEGKWYDNIQGLEFLHKYPQDFINWLNEPDTWAETYVRKYRINKMIDIFNLWVNETY